MSTDTEHTADTCPTAEQDRRQLASVVRRAVKRLESKLAKQQEEFRQAADHELYKQYGDTILASLHTMRRGMDECTLPNVHTNAIVSIRLNPKLDGPENAALYFKKARKGRRGVEMIELNVGQTRATLDEMAAIRGRLETPPEPPPTDEALAALVAEARQRLQALGVLPGQRPGKRPDDHEDVPYRHVTFEGFDMYVGRNDEQNDQLTVHFAKPWDLWLHVAAHAGSHVVIRRQKNTPWPPERVINAAAGLAVWFSKAKHTNSMDVHITERRYVQKRRHTPAGEVSLMNYKTVRAAPISPQELHRLQRGSIEEHDE